jgi:hypothetical protein
MTDVADPRDTPYEPPAIDAVTPVTGLLGSGTDATQYDN